MKSNMGLVDRVLRLAASLIIVALFYTGAITGIVAIALFVIGAIFLLTSFISICPLYSLLHIRTCKKVS